MNTLPIGVLHKTMKQKIEETFLYEVIFLNNSQS